MISFGFSPDRGNADKRRRIAGRRPSRGSRCGQQLRGDAEALLRLRELNVTESDGERVGGVRRLRNFFERKNGANHLLHLRFIGVAVSGDGGFHFARRLTVHGNIALRGGEENYSADFREAQSGFDI